MKKKRKQMPETETRKKLLQHAKRIGAEQDLQQLFNKWDRVLALAPPNEKMEMSRLAILEVQALLDIYAERGDGLTINDEIVVSASPKKRKNEGN